MTRFRRSSRPPGTLRRAGTAVAAGALALAGAVALPAAPARADASAKGDVIANLWEWNWDSIASECTNVLGPAGYGAVQVAPPAESLKQSSCRDPFAVLQPSGWG
ncbi:hypothetical protein ACFV5G_25120 [Streptomyces sp. NPDC059766]|uniref:hypothetical protein n=1 Tax=Streptomyces sp. NPDC059766 TaxID=3346940 RepID=UPI0036649CC1